MPDRHRALQAATDWSYALLGAEEQSLFAQLAEFAGGFKMADAEAVCQAIDMFDGVAGLLAHSFLRGTTDPATQESRFTMLEWLRHYAGEMLAADPDAGALIQRRHAEHYARFAGERLARLRGRREADAPRNTLTPTRHRWRTGAPAAALVE